MEDQSLKLVEPLSVTSVLDSRVLYLNGSPEGEHLRCEFNKDSVLLIMSLGTAVLDTIPSQFKPLHPRFREKHLVRLSFKQLESMVKLAKEVEYGDL